MILMVTFFLSALANTWLSLSTTQVSDRVNSLSPFKRLEISLRESKHYAGNQRHR